jgi:hypothetical protein
MSPQLHRLLSIQGALLDKFLEQNLGERYAYLILVGPAHGTFDVGALTNLADATLVEPVAVQFAERVGKGRVTQIVQLSHAQALESDGGAA